MKKKKTVVRICLFKTASAHWTLRWRSEQRRNYYSIKASKETIFPINNRRKDLKGSKEIVFRNTKRVGPKFYKETVFYARNQRILTKPFFVNKKQKESKVSKDSVFYKQEVRQIEGY